MNELIGRSLEDIIELWRERKATTSPLIDRMRSVRDGYNGEVIVPLPEMDMEEQSAVANLISIGLDQTGMRIASTLPSVYYPPVEESNRASMNRARTRTRANYAWWETNEMELKLRLRSRKLIGYASSPVLLKPDMKKGCPKWVLRDPLSSYVADTTDASDMTPDDAIFTFERKRSWLKKNYPEQLATLKTDGRASMEDKFTIIEYHDAEVTVMAVVSSEHGNFSPVGGREFAELERVINRTGMCLVVAPGRMTLDRQQGQYDGLVGMYQTMAELMALDLIAVKKGVFPDMFLESNPNEVAKFESGPHNGRTGKVNIISGGRMREVALNPGYASGAMLDRLERNMRVTGGIASEMGGESQTNVRTGKRGDAILSAVIDFPVQEAQAILERSMMFENVRAVAVTKTYFGNDRKSFYISTRGKKGHVDYVPSKDFETDNNVVKFPLAGADSNGITVKLGQLVGGEMISKRGAMEIETMIEDPELEHDRIIMEALEKTMLVGLEQQVTSGQMPTPDVAKLMIYVGTNKMELAEAITKVHEEAQARQATVAPPGAPETMPGIANPGMGAEQPTVNPATQSQDNLAGLLSRLRSPQAGAA